MTLSTETAVSTYTGDGSTVEFSFPYLVFQSSHVSITVDGIAEVGWSATGYGDSAGITITFDTAPANTSSVIIKRIVPLTQATDLQNFDGNPSDVQEKQFDLNVMISQQQQEQIDRCLKLPSDNSVTSLELTDVPTSETQFLTVTSSGFGLGNPSNITFDTTFSDLADGDLLKYNGSVWQNVTQASLGLLQDVLSDTTPQLGGNLDVNGQKIVSTSNADIDIEPNGTGNVILGNFTFNADQSVGAGQDNYVMTYDHGSGTIGLESAAVGGGGDGLVWLGSLDVSSAVTSIDIGSGLDLDVTFDSTYERYIIDVIDAVPSTDDTVFLIRTSSDGGSTFDSGSTDYKTVTIGNRSGDSSSTTTTSNGTNAISTMDATVSAFNGAGNASGESFNSIITLFNPAGTEKSIIMGELAFISADDRFIRANFGGSRDSAADVDAIRLFMSSGNIASAKIKVYGVKK